MISVSEATNLIQTNTLTLPAVEVPLADAIGKVLREPVTADRDFPPYNRVAMDGIAIQFNSYQAGEDFFRIEGIQLAGAPPLTLRNPDGCLEVMTGAMLPNNTDTVIRYEDIKMIGRNNIHYAQIQEAPKAPLQNVHRQGNDHRANDLLILEGTLLTPAEIAVAATVGKTSLKVTQVPKVAIIATGDELVEIHEEPLPYQIRKSNAYMLQSAMQEQGVSADLLHFPDEQDIIELQLRKLLKIYDVLLLSGGVSKGKADFLPEVLEHVGVHKLFHEVAQRPGKPFWFGRVPNSAVVFALPGNPVSTFVCYYRYVQPWLRACVGAKPALPVKAKLQQDFTFKPNLTYFLPVRVVADDQGRLLARPVKDGGSGDLAALLKADGFLELPQHKADFTEGELFSFVRFRY